MHMFLNYDKVQITCLGLRLGLGLVLGLLLGLVLGLVLANPKPNLSYGNRFGCCEQMITSELSLTPCLRCSC